jgi:hypothetical protein
MVATCGTPILTSANFKEMRAVATRAIRIAARRAGVTLEEALDRTDRLCSDVRWSTWIALGMLDWQAQDIARLFYVVVPTVTEARRLAGVDVVAEAAAIAGELRGRP